MKLVIDSNRLQSEELLNFLARSKSNVAVVTDYVAMEAYKGNTLDSIFKSMKVLASFPAQVVVLKGTRAVCGLRGRDAGLQRRLIDEAQTKEFPVYIKHLEQARHGNAHLRQQLLDLGLEATSHFDRLLDDAKSTGEVIKDIATLYSKEERATIRKGEIPPQETVDKIVKNVMTIAAQLFGSHPNAGRFPSYMELRNTYIFRASLCTYLLVLDWISVGGADKATAKRLRNDFVDMHFAAYATYFDGLMSDDRKTAKLHAEARVWLMALFDCRLPSGVGYGCVT